LLGEYCCRDYCELGQLSWVIAHALLSLRNPGRRCEL
jgi:hypothetical protein